MRRRACADLDFLPECARGLTTSQFYTWSKRLRGGAAQQFLEVQVVKTPARPIPPKRGAIETRLRGCPAKWKRVR